MHTEHHLMCDKKLDIVQPVDEHYHRAYGQRCSTADGNTGNVLEFSG